MSERARVRKGRQLFSRPSPVTHPPPLSFPPGEISAAEALRQACVDLTAACGHVSRLARGRPCAPHARPPSLLLPAVSLPTPHFLFSPLLFQIRTTFAAALETGEAGAPIPDAPPPVPRAKRAGGPEAAAAAAATMAALAGLSGA